MQPQTERSVLDWLKEQLGNPRQLLQRLWPARNPAPAQAQTTEPGGDAKITVEPPQSGNEIQANIQTVPHPDSSSSYPARVNITAELQHGTTLTITIHADQDGNINVAQNTRSANLAVPAKATPTRQMDVAGAAKTVFGKIQGAFQKIYDFIDSKPILRNGIIFSGLGLAAAVMADTSLREAQAFTPGALTPLLIGGALFAWATWAINRNGAGLLDDAAAIVGPGFVDDKKRQQIALGLIGVGLALSFWVSRDSVGGLTVNTIWMLLRWTLAIVLVCLAAWMLQMPREQESNPTSRWLVLGLAAILLLAFGLRIWQLGSLPYTLGGDEGEQGTEILRILSGNLTNPFVTGWYGVPTFSFFFNLPTVALFGNTSFGIRLMWVLTGTASILVTYLLVKELKGTRLALITAALVATFHYHLHFSRLGSNQISDTLLVGLTLLFLMRGYLKSRWLDWALAGVFAGIGQYFYAGGRLAITLALFMILFLWVRDGFKVSRQNRIGLGIFLFALLIAGGPMFAFAIEQPDQYNTRANQIGILQNGWLANEAIILGKTQAEVLLDQFYRAAFFFNAYWDRASWYGLQAPLLDTISGPLFLVGIISASLWSLRDRRLAPMVAWWWSAILTGGMLTDTTPSSQRLITTSIPVMFFVAWSIDHIIAALNRHLHKRLGLAVGIVLIAVISFTSLNLYFNEYTPKRIYGGEHAMIGTMISEHVSDDLGPDTDIYFFGAPRMYAGIGTMRYLIPEINKIDVTEPLTSPFSPDPQPAAQNLLFIFLPERLGELEWVRQTYPEGQFQDVSSPAEPEKILYSIYSVEQP